MIMVYHEGGRIWVSRDHRIWVSHGYEWVMDIYIHVYHRIWVSHGYEWVMDMYIHIYPRIWVRHGLPPSRPVLIFRSYTQNESCHTMCMQAYSSLFSPALFDVQVTHTKWVRSHCSYVWVLVFFFPCPSWC